MLLLNSVSSSILENCLWDLGFRLWLVVNKDTNYKFTHKFLMMLWYGYDIMNHNNPILISSKWFSIKDFCAWWI